MRPILRTTLPLLVLLALPTIACAQGGCVNSPENPTLVLALIGAAAAACRKIRLR